MKHNKRLLLNHRRCRFCSFASFLRTVYPVFASYFSSLLGYYQRKHRKTTPVPGCLEGGEKVMNPTPEPQTQVSKKKRHQVQVRRHPGQTKKRKLYALLLAALIPGLGHLYLGMYRKGITFIMLLPLDISALLYFSSIGMQINVPPLVVLGLLIPVGYFYNVYDVRRRGIYYFPKRRGGRLAASEDGSGRNHPFRGERGIAFGLMLVVTGAAHFVSPEAALVAGRNPRLWCGSLCYHADRYRDMGGDPGSSPPPKRQGQIPITHTVVR